MLVLAPGYKICPSTWIGCVPKPARAVSCTAAVLLCRGDEASKLSAFKTALGLSDEDAAPVHVEVARRLFRQV